MRPSADHGPIAGRPRRQSGSGSASGSRVLDDAYRKVGGRLAADSSAVSVDDDSRLHVERLQAIAGPPSLVELRRQLNGHSQAR